MSERKFPRKGRMSAWRTVFPGKPFQNNSKGNKLKKKTEINNPVASGRPRLGIANTLVFSFSFIPWELSWIESVGKSRFSSDWLNLEENWICGIKPETLKANVTALRKRIEADFPRNWNSRTAIRLVPGERLSYSPSPLVRWSGNTKADASVYFSHKTKDRHAILKSDSREE